MNNTKELPILKSQLLEKEAGIIHFSTLRGAATSPYSSINLCSYTGDDPEHVSFCREMFASYLGITTTRMWFPRQVHGDKILVVSSAMTDNQEADAVITQEPNLLIGVSTADCVPVLLYDKDTRTIAAIHAGWRGTISGIVKKTVLKMILEFGTDPDNLKAYIGPSISPEAFEVGDEVADRFVEAGYSSCVICGVYAKKHIDLWHANKLQLISAGVCVENIDCVAVCTYNNSEMLFSARKLGIKSGRITTAIMLKE